VPHAAGFKLVRTERNLNLGADEYMLQLEQLVRTERNLNLGADECMSLATVQRQLEQLVSTA
jgi:hypothetical protein